MAPAGYSRTQIALHWGMALLIGVNLIFEDWIEAGWEAIEDGFGPVYDAGALAHIGVGVTVLVLAMLRLALRFGRGVPDLPPGMGAPERLAAAAGHAALYALMTGVPIVGLMAWFGSSETMAEVHELGEPAFLLLIGLHVAAAVWHQFVRKDGVLDRMRRAG